MSSRNVLIAHESRTIRNRLKSYILSELDDRIVFEVSSARDAIQVYQEQKFGVLICSKELPDLDGISLYKKIQTLPNSKECPFILVTSNSTSRNIKSLSEQGISHYLVFPFTAKELKNKINSVCDPRKWRVYERVHIPGAKAVICLDSGAIEGDVVNISLDGVACDFVCTNKYSSLLENTGITLKFPAEYHNIQISNMPCKFVRLSVLGWKANLTPETVRLALRFVGLSLHHQHLKILEQVIEKTKKGFE